MRRDFVWDAQDAYLFDIDGTLLRTRDRIHVDSVHHSVQRVTGFEVTLAGIVLHGATDTAILREACDQAGIPSDVLESQTTRYSGSHVRLRHRATPQHGPGADAGR